MGAGGEFLAAHLITEETNMRALHVLFVCSWTQSGPGLSLGEQSLTIFGNRVF